MFGSLDPRVSFPSDKPAAVRMYADSKMLYIITGQRPGDVKTVQLNIRIYWSVCLRGLCSNSGWNNGSKAKLLIDSVRPLNTCCIELFTRPFYVTWSGERCFYFPRALNSVAVLNSELQFNFNIRFGVLIELDGHLLKQEWSPSKALRSGAHKSNGNRAIRV